MDASARITWKRGHRSSAGQGRGVTSESGNKRRRSQQVSSSPSPVLSLWGHTCPSYFTSPEGASGDAVTSQVIAGRKLQSLQLAPCLLSQSMGGRTGTWPGPFLLEVPAVSHDTHLDRNCWNSGKFGTSVLALPLYLLTVTLDK